MFGTPIMLPPSQSPEEENLRRERLHMAMEEAMQSWYTEQHDGQGQPSHGKGSFSRQGPY